MRNLDQDHDFGMSEEAERNASLEMATRLIRRGYPLRWSMLHPGREAEDAARILRGITKWTKRDLSKCGLETLYLLAKPALTPTEVAAVKETNLFCQMKCNQREQRRAEVQSMLGERYVFLFWHGIKLQATIAWRGECCRSSLRILANWKTPLHHSGKSYRVFPK
jgi:hypothetical protein